MARGGCRDHHCSGASPVAVHSSTKVPPVAIVERLSSDGRALPDFRGVTSTVSSKSFQLRVHREQTCVFESWIARSCCTAALSRSGDSAELWSDVFERRCSREPRTGLAQSRKALLAVFHVFLTRRWLADKGLCYGPSNLGFRDHLKDWRHRDHRCRPSRPRRVAPEQGARSRPLAYAEGECLSQTSQRPGAFR